MDHGIVVFMALTCVGTGLRRRILVGNPFFREVTMAAKTQTPQRLLVPQPSGEQMASPAAGIDAVNANRDDAPSANDADGPRGGPPTPAAPGMRPAAEPTALTVGAARQVVESVSTDAPSLQPVASAAMSLMRGGHDQEAVVIVGGGPTAISALITFTKAVQMKRRSMHIFIVDDAPRHQLGRGAPFRHLPGRGDDYVLMNMFTPSVQLNKLTKLIHKGLNELSAVTVPDFARRCDVGDVLAVRAVQAFRDADAVGLSVTFVQGRAVDLLLRDDASAMVYVRHADGSMAVLLADAVILAVGNEGSSRYQALHGPGFIDDPWSATGGIHSVPRNATVAVAGSSLAALDVASVLEGQGHQGKIHIYSPSGRLPGVRPLHAPTALNVLAPDRLQEVLAGEKLPLSIEDLLKLVDRELQSHGESLVPILLRLYDYLTLDPRDFLIREAKRTGRLSKIWGIQKSLDDVIAPLWRVLGQEAREFVIKHLGTVAALQWSAAPPTGHRVMSMLHEGRVELHSAKTATRRQSDGRFVVTCKDGSKFDADVFVDASGFAGSLGEFRDDLIVAMRARGLLTPHETGMGANASFEDGRLLDAEDRPVGPIWASACALTRGVYLLTNELGEATHSGLRAAESVLGYLDALASQRQVEGAAPL